MMKSTGYEAEAPKYPSDIVRNPADLQKLKPRNSTTFTFWTDKNNTLYCPVWDTEMNKVRLLSVASKAIVDQPLDYPLHRRD